MVCLEAYKQYPEYKGMSLFSCLNTVMFDRKLEVVRNKYVLRPYQFPSIIYEIATTQGVIVCLMILINSWNIVKTWIKNASFVMENERENYSLVIGRRPYWAY